MRIRLAALLILWASPAWATCGPEIGVGNYVACAISNTDGALDCWGANTYPELLTDVPAGSFTVSDGGDTYHCAVATDTGVDCWGDECVGCTVMSETPAGTGYEYVAPCIVAACALKTDDSIECWGDSESFDAAPSGSYLWMRGDEDTYCGVKLDGTLACWGFDYAEGVFTEPATTLYDKVDATANYACAITNADALECWGDTVTAGSPPAGTYTQVAVNSDPAGCAVATDGTIDCWGSDACNIVGEAPAGTDFVQIDCSSCICCATDTSGAITCWGLAPDIETGAPGITCAAAAASSHVIIFIP